MNWEERIVQLARIKHVQCARDRRTDGTSVKVKSMNGRGVVEVLAVANGVGCRECLDAIESGRARHTSTETTTMGDLRSLYEVRRRATERAGKRIVGLRELCEKLQSLDPRGLAEAHYYVGTNESCLVVVSSEGELVGCNDIA